LEAARRGQDEKQAAAPASSVIGVVWANAGSGASREWI